MTISCGQSRDAVKKKEIEYKVCSDTELPDELKTMIEERKEKEFQLIYENSVHSYFVAGYGRQKCAEYAVTIKAFYDEGDNILLDTLLVNHSKAETEKSGQPELCPYIVIRCDLIKKPVVFR
jgi:hypothetical protein